MISTRGTLLRLFFAGAILFASLAAALVFSGVIPPYYQRAFSDADYGAPQLAYRLTTYDALDGWLQDDPGLALNAFMQSCAVFEAQLPAAPANSQENLGAAHAGVSLSGTVADWRRPCAEARALMGSAYSDPGVRRGALRAFFEFHFRPVEILVKRDPLPEGRAHRARPRLEPEGVFTGYFEPVYKASRTRSDVYSAPVLPRPDDLIEVDLGQFRGALKGERIAGRVVGGRLAPYAGRTEIEAADVAHVAPLAWLDPNDLFFLQIQGSGRLVFDDGGVLRVGYAGQNGHAYTAIGRVMVERGLMPLEAVSMASIRAWLERATPDEAAALRAANASYVFFTKLDDAGANAEPGPQEGPLGAQGAPLTAGRSLAVDRRYHTLGAPVWVNIEPAQGGLPRPVIRRLMIAQDTGGAIKGPVRGDVYWGSGEEAGAMAGAMNARGRMVVLLPNRLAQRLAQQQAGPNRPADADQGQ